MDQSNNIREDSIDGKNTGCVLDDFLNFLAQRWMSHIIWTLGRHEAIRFGALRRALPGDISARVLSQRLKALEDEGLVVRRDFGTMPLHVEYSLTSKGRALDAELQRNEARVRSLDAAS
ncbi:winged helix-turn-helix transcriptional regulator [Mesorhizobium sp. L-8-10]|uniref:winged helix-turn-helix transcriptional regulator n=1 Tax=Mesorhizobium sp. L-8-10 TaxID=2744523 RepID=UPI00192979DE|nr:helix-turn-helix domain-containing protein [Mesorhizobium sp. L-8-10]